MAENQSVSNPADSRRDVAADHDEAGAAPDVSAADGRAEGADPQIEENARLMGWVPENEFKGSKDEWISAEEFIERGERVLPILRANNRRLREDLVHRDHELDSIKSQLGETNKILGVLRKGYEESQKHAIEEATKDLRSQLIEAKKAGDVDLEMDIQDQLDELKDKKPTPLVKDETQSTPSTPALDPDFVSWQKDNTWFGGTSRDDQRKTQDIIWIGEDLRKAGDRTTGRAFIEKCLDTYNQQHRSVSKVDGGGRGSSSFGPRKFSSLSQAAKDACHEDMHKFVGPGKMFKTNSEYEDYWMSLYSEQ